MGRLFLSGQTTCALLLGAGLLLRAQAAIRQDPEPAPAAQQAVATPGTRPSQMFEDHLARATRTPRPPVSPRSGRGARSAPRTEESVSHSRKGFAHRLRRAQGKRCGAALAQAHRSFKCG